MLKLFALTPIVVLSIFYASCTKTDVIMPRDAAAVLDSLLENLDPDAESVFMQNASRDPRVNNRLWEGIPSISADKDSKEIYVAWYSGGHNEGAGNYITVALSLNGGKSFMNDKLVVFPADTTRLRFFDPSLWRDKNNKIWLTWAKSHDWWDGKGGVWMSGIDWNGRVIEHNEVEEIAKGVLMNKPSQIASQNCVLFPVSLWNIAPSDPFKQGTFIYRGVYKNGAVKVDSLQKISQIYVDDNLRTFDEHQIVELDLRGKMMCMVRTLAGIYYTISQDYGVTWQPLKPFKAVGPTASSRFHLARLRSGKILLIVNNSNERTRLTAFLSSNGGVTWPGRLVIDRRDNVSYPDATQTSDGFIHVVYDRERTKDKEILYCKFKEPDMFSSTFILPKVKVNSH